MFLGYADGGEVMADPVAESDEELVELIQVLAAYSGLSTRPFDTANPQLDVRLPDGSRLSAVMDVTIRPAVSIRRARLGKVFLTDLVGNGTISPEVASFLAAAAAARKNIMIAGATNAGKTTLLRAIANQIPPGERLITVERALELGIDHFPDLHPNVVAFEERLPNSEGQGGISMAELVRRSLRMNPSRVIVGEVLGDEIVTMLNAMTQGNDGSLSTIHANSSLEVFNRIATYAIQSAERLPVEATHMLIAGAIDFVVFIEKRNDYSRGGRLRRYVSSIREVTGVDGRVLSSEVFAPGPGRPRGAARPAGLRRAAGRARLRPGRGRHGEGLSRCGPAAGRAGGAACGAGLLLLAVAVRGLPPAAARAADAAGPAAAARAGRLRGAAALAAGAVALVATGWLVAARRGGAAGVRLAGAVRRGRGAQGPGPAGGAGHLDRVAARHDRRGGGPGTGDPRLAAGGGAGHRGAADPLVDRLHIRVPMPDALLRFADDLDDPGADLIVAALVINARLRGPGLRDLLGSLSASVREELDMRRKVTAERRSTRRSVQIVVGVSVGMALALALLNHAFLAPYDGVFGQVVLAAVVGIYAVGIFWLRRLARFEVPQRLLTTSDQFAHAEGSADGSSRVVSPSG